MCAATMISSAGPDDKRETVSARLAAYYSQTAPILPHYRDSGRLITLDGMADVDAVTRAVEGGSGPRGRAHNNLTRLPLTKGGCLV